MKLHGSAIERIIRLVESTTNQDKLRAEIRKLDLHPYEQKLNNGGNIVLVLTEDYEAQLRNLK